MSSEVSLRTTPSHTRYYGRTVLCVIRDVTHVVQEAREAHVGFGFPGLPHLLVLKAGTDAVLRHYVEQIRAVPATNTTREDQKR